MDLSILYSFCDIDKLSLLSCKGKRCTQFYMSVRSYRKCPKQSDKLTAQRKYYEPSKSCTFSLHSCVGPSSLLVAPCYMERLVGVGKVSKVLRLAIAVPVFFIVE